MAMSRKDYVLIAKVIRTEMEYAEDPTAIVDVARSLARSLAQANSNFQLNTFYEACGVERAIHGL